MHQSVSSVSQWSTSVIRWKCDVTQWYIYLFDLFKYLSSSKNSMHRYKFTGISAYIHSKQLDWRESLSLLPGPGWVPLAPANCCIKWTWQSSKFQKVANATGEDVSDADQMIQQLHFSWMFPTALSALLWPQVHKREQIFAFTDLYWFHDESFGTSLPIHIMGHLKKKCSVK